VLSQSNNNLSNRLSNIVAQLRVTRRGSLALVGRTRASREEAVEHLVRELVGISNFRQPNGFVTVVGNGEDAIDIESVRHIHIALQHRSNHMRVVVIDSLENMTERTAGVLLKIVEEPPQDAIFLILAASYDARFAVLFSRCMIVRLPQQKDDSHDIETYKALLSLTSAKDGGLLNALYLLASRAIDRHLSFDTELFVNEWAALDKIMAGTELDDLLYHVGHIADDVQKATEINMNSAATFHFVVAKLAKIGRTLYTS
jgi:hypothetical protein